VRRSPPMPSPRCARLPLPPHCRAIPGARRCGRGVGRGREDFSAPRRAVPSGREPAPASGWRSAPRRRG
jgi:hypothetical protein